MIKGIIFDWTGTLGSVKDVGSVGDVIGEERKYKLLTSQIGTIRMNAEEKVAVKEILDGAVLSLYGDSEKFIKKLKEKGYLLAIISDMYAVTTDRVREKFSDFLSHFDKIILSAEVGLKKPSKEIFKYTLHELGLNPDEALMIGDKEEKDFIVPQELGMNARLIDRNSQSLKDVLGDLI